MIKVFVSKNNEEYIQGLLNDLNELFTEATIIGATTDGEIMNGSISENKTVLSFLQFDNVYLQSHYTEEQANSYESGRNLADKIITPNTKLLFMFADGIHTNGQLLRPEGRSL